MEIRHDQRCQSNPAGAGSRSIGAFDSLTVRAPRLRLLYVLLAEQDHLRALPRPDSRGSAKLWRTHLARPPSAQTDRGCLHPEPVADAARESVMAVETASGSTQAGATARRRRASPCRNPPRRRTGTDWRFLLLVIRTPGVTIPVSVDVRDGMIRCIADLGPALVDQLLVASGLELVVAGGRRGPRRNAYGWRRLRPGDGRSQVTSATMLEPAWNPTDRGARRAPREHA